MTKSNPKHDDSLPKHQRKIVLSLAKHGAMTMTETNKKLHGHITSTARAFHELETKVVVTPVDTHPYHGRNFSIYWLTNKGIAYALLNGADSERMRDHALKFSIDRMMRDFFELRSISPEIANLLDQTMFRAGTVSYADLLNLSVSVGIATKGDALQKFVNIIKKSEERQDYLKRLRMIREFFEALEVMLTASEEGKDELSGA